MVKKFEFRDHRTKLDIAGEIFYLDVTDKNLLNRVLEFSKESQELARNVNTDNYVEDLENAMEFMQKSIDNILGEGASKKIFKDRAVSFMDLLDVIKYINEVIIKERTEKLVSYTPNRATRRAKK